MQKKKGFVRVTMVCAAMVGLLCNFMSLEVEASTPNPLESRSVVDLESVEFSDLVGLSEQYFHTESQYDLEDPMYALSNLWLNQSTVYFEENGYVQYVDAIGMKENGDYVNVSEFASWSTSDMDVATVFNGRINATGKGRAEITVSYGGYSCELQVIVENEVDVIGKITEQVSMQRAESPEYIRTLAIYSQTWSPNSNIYQWGSTSQSPQYFVAGTTYTGYPYTQYGDCYPVSYLGANIFTSVLNNSNFLTLTTRVSSLGNSVYCPYYGLDCSGLVCYALQTPQKYVTESMINNIGSGVFSKVGNYSVTSPTENELKVAYESLAIGDALVKYGHCFLVVSNVPSQQKVTVIEQTPPKTTYSTYTYSKLAEDRYRPFSYN